MYSHPLYRLSRSFVAQFCLVALLSLAAFAPASSVFAQNFADDAFRSLWQRTDAPVSAGITSRTYLWGGAPFATQQERYDESPLHLRTVQYFDKGRMELTNPNVNPDNQFYVTSGLLVRDLVAGIVQVGDNKVQVYDPAQIAVVGDPAPVNADAPLYADFLTDLIYPSARNRIGDVISTTVQVHRKLGKLASKDLIPTVKYAYFENHTNHNIASPFWNYFSSKGLVYDTKGSVVNDAKLFDWQFLMGYPISEPYWTNTKVGGKTTLVLVQLFERRVLSYTLSNPTAFQVEMGNVGQHYYNWRYSPAPVMSGNLAVPASINGKINPQYGNLDTIFTFTATGFAPDEAADFSIQQPDGSVVSIPDPVGADDKGQISGSFQGRDLVGVTSVLQNSQQNSLGIYALNFNGKTSNHVSKIYCLLLVLPPVTPTTPYRNDKSVPASINAQVNPKVGPRGTDFTAVIDSFYEKDFGFDRLSVWVTTPEGQVQELTQVSEIDETPFGIMLDLGSPSHSGVWAVTFQDKSNAQHKAIVYLRVTDAPPEFSIGSAFGLIASSSAGGTGMFNISSTFKPLNQMSSSQNRGQD